MKTATVAQSKELYKARVLNLPYTEFLANLKKEALLSNVPILSDQSIAFLRLICELHKPKLILEIGSAVGYSASWLVHLTDGVVYTMERDPTMFEELKKNISLQKLEDRITPYCGDALSLFDEVSHLSFDILFIDAAKAQYKKFFELYAPLVKEGGLIISDNLFFHDLLFEETSKQTHGLTKRLALYNEFLLEREGFQSTILDIGDGIGVSIKCK